MSLKPRIDGLNPEILEITYVSRHENQPTLVRGRGQERIDRPAPHVWIERSDAPPVVRDRAVDRNRSTRKGCRDPLESALENGTALLIELHLNATPDLAERYDAEEDRAVLALTQPANDTGFWRGSLALRDNVRVEQISVQGLTLPRKSAPIIGREFSSQTARQESHREEIALYRTADRRRPQGG